jgi:hypothetical protein
VCGVSGQEGQGGVHVPDRHTRAGGCVIHGRLFVVAKAGVDRES